MKHIPIYLLALSVSAAVLAQNGGYSPAPVPTLSDWSLVGLAVFLSVAAVGLFRNRK